MDRIGLGLPAVLAPIAFMTALAGSASGSTQSTAEISVREAIASRPGQYSNPVVMVAEPARIYGILLRDERCTSLCRDVVQLRIPESIEARRDVALLLSDIDSPKRKKDEKLRAVLVVKLVHGRRPLNRERTKFGWGLGWVELVKVVEVKTLSDPSR